MALPLREREEPDETTVWPEILRLRSKRVAGGEGSDEEPDADVLEVDATEAVGLDRSDVVRLLIRKSEKQ